MIARAAVRTVYTIEPPDVELIVKIGHRKEVDAI